MNIGIDIPKYKFIDIDEFWPFMMYYQVFTNKGIFHYCCSI